MMSENTKQIMQSFAEALRENAKGNGKTVALIKSFLSKASLSPDQETMVDLIITLMDDDQYHNPENELDEFDGSEEKDDDLNDDLERYPKELQHIKEELEDLREANDTMAAALGACPLCWGGDPNCSTCQGRGHPGYMPPDPALFDQLVMPAVKRAYTARRAPERAGYHHR